MNFNILWRGIINFTWLHLMYKEQLVRLLLSQLTFLPLYIIYGSSVNVHAHYWFIFMPILGDADQKSCSSGNENYLCRIMKRIHLKSVHQYGILTNLNFALTRYISYFWRLLLWIIEWTYRQQIFIFDSEHHIKYISQKRDIDVKQP